MRQPVVTEAPEFAGPVPDRTPVDLASLRAGQTVVVRTLSGSTYWVTATTSVRLRGRKVYGLSIMTDSESFGRVVEPPAQVYTDRYVRPGYGFALGRRGFTSDVDTVKVI